MMMRNSIVLLDWACSVKFQDATHLFGNLSAKGGLRDFLLIYFHVRILPYVNPYFCSDRVLSLGIIPADTSWGHGLSC